MRGRPTENKLSEQKTNAADSAGTSSSQTCVEETFTFNPENHYWPVLQRQSEASDL